MPTLPVVSLARATQEVVCCFGCAGLLGMASVVSGAQIVSCELLADAQLVSGRSGPDQRCSGKHRAYSLVLVLSCPVVS